MKRKLMVSGMVATLLVAAVAVAALWPGDSSETAAAATPDAHIAHWDAVAMEAAMAPGNGPAEQYTIFAYLGIAVYDSVVAIEGGYAPFLVDEEAPDGASAEAAVAGAARKVLLHYIPAQSAIIENGYLTALAMIPDGPGKQSGLAFGESVAEQVIGARASDGFKAPAEYPVPDPAEPGEWIPSGPKPIGVYSGKMTPFVLKSADQFRPAGAPALDSKQWAKEYNEVRVLGSADSAVRTPEQTLAAKFWAEHPVAQSHASYRQFVTERELGLGDASRFMAMVTVTQADAFIACFDAKYHYAFWRPATAIQNGDNDGNPATPGDPAWKQLLGGIPNHPEYPSAHSCLTPAAAEVISRFVKSEHIDFTIPSLTGLGDRHYAKAKDLRTEVAEARIWGGIHFRSAVEDGSKIGMKTAHEVLSKHFKKAR